MNRLKPDWNQQKPSSREAERMCETVGLAPTLIENTDINFVLERLRTTHIHGGALFGALRVGEDIGFDWFASRNRLLEYDILSRLLCRNEVRNLLPDLDIPQDFSSMPNDRGSCVAKSGGTFSSGSFKFDNPFSLDGQLAQILFTGGAYTSKSEMTGFAAMELAGAFCNATFGRRYEEISIFTSYAAWTPWFCGIAWDWTSIFFDRGTRKLWLLAVTDTD